MEKSDIVIQELDKEFVGVGSVRGFKYTQVKRADHGFIYKVDTGDAVHYEIFQYKATPICVDFMARIFSKTTFRERYPKDGAFGIWAWTAMKLERAEEILDGIKERKQQQPVQLQDNS